MINAFIPSEFTLAGMNFTVEEKDSLKDEDGTCLYGQFDTNKCVIYLANTINGEQVTCQSTLNSFYHELAHVLQYYYDNNLDESFAQSVGNLLMQYSQTKK